MQDVLDRINHICYNLATVQVHDVITTCYPTVPGTQFISLSGPNVHYVSHMKSVIAVLKFTQRNKTTTTRAQCFPSYQQAQFLILVGME